MKSAGKARNNGLYRHIRTSKEIIRNLLNDSNKYIILRLNQSSNDNGFQNLIALIAFYVFSSFLTSGQVGPR